jgi:putative oxidoreductase
MKAVFLIGRIVFGGFFFVAGWNHLTHHAAMARMVARGGIPMPELAVIGSGLMILIVGASILLGWYPRTGCVLIAIFLAVVTPLAHNFWNTHTAAEQGEALNNFTKNAGLFGGALMAMMISTPWPWSVEAAASRRRAISSRAGT